MRHSGKYGVSDRKIEKLSVHFVTILLSSAELQLEENATMNALSEYLADSSVNIT